MIAPRLLRLKICALCFAFVLSGFVHAVDASLDWPTSINSNAIVHFFTAESNGFSAPAGSHWKASLSFAEDGDQTFDVIHVNETNGPLALRSTAQFMNIADSRFATWADAPELDVLLQVFGDEKLFLSDGSGKEVTFRTGSLNHEN